jgi:hypothetical protein
MQPQFLLVKFGGVDRIAKEEAVFDQHDPFRISLQSRVFCE